MPGFNQTGPVGQGPMTGRRMGRCNSSNKQNTGNEIKNAVTGLFAVLVVSVADWIWEKIKEKRLKSGINK